MQGVAQKLDMLCTRGKQGHDNIRNGVVLLCQPSLHRISIPPHVTLTIQNDKRCFHRGLMATKGMETKNNRYKSWFVLDSLYYVATKLRVKPV